MLSYNQQVEDKELLKSKLEYMLNVKVGYGEGTEPDVVEIKDIKYTHPQLSYIDCLVRNIPYNYIITVVSEVVSGPNKGYVFESEFELPKQCKSGFLIPDSSGNVKWRSPINLIILTQNIYCHTREEDNIRKIYICPIITGQRYVISLDPTLSSEPQNPKISYKEHWYEDGEYKEEIKECDLLGYLIDNGIPEDEVRNVLKTAVPISYGNSFDIKINDDDRFQMMLGKVLQLTKKEVFPKKKNCFSAESIFDLVKLAINNPSAYEYFGPFDCVIKDQLDVIFDELKASNKRYEILKQNEFTFRNSRSFNLNMLTRNLKSVFSLQSKTFHSVQVSSDSNAGAFLSQTKKTYFQIVTSEENCFERTYKTESKKIHYTDDFVGMICPANTPESASSTNIRNELAKAVNIRNGKSYITVIDKKGKDKELSFIDYYRSRILSSNCWDYDNNKIIELNDKSILILKLGEYNRVTPSMDAFDYIQHDPGSIFSYSTSMIPMANHCDSVRLSMASNMFNQAIPTENSRPPVIYTGTESEIYKKSDLNMDSEYDGKVEDILGNEFIKIRDTEGKVHVVKTPPSQETMNHTYLRYVPNIKPGDEIHKGDILMTSDSFKDKELALMNQVRTAFVHFMFQEEEDGFVISESASKYFTHVVDKEVEIAIPKDSEFLFNLEEAEKLDIYERKYDKSKFNEFGLPKIGAEFGKNEIVAFYLTQSRSSIDSKLYQLGSGGAVRLEAVPAYAPYNINHSKVVDVTVRYKKGLTTPGNTHLKMLQYYDNIRKENIDRVNKFTGFNSDLVSPPYLTDKNTAILVTIKFRSYNSLKLGDKLTNRYASKGTIIAIYPDDQMPRVGGPNGPRIDVISSPNAPYNRKNLAQLIEQDLMKISHEAWVRGSKLIEDKDFNQLRADLNLINITDKFTNMSDDELIKYHDSYKDFYRLHITVMDKKYTTEKVRELAKFFGVDLINGEYLYFPYSFKKLDIECDEKRMTRNKVQVGFSELMRLHFFPENKSRATAEEENDEQKLVLGNGKERVGGQRQGQMEIWTYTAHDTLDDLAKATKKNMYDEARNGMEVRLNLLGLQLILNK